MTEVDDASAPAPGRLARGSASRADVRLLLPALATWSVVAASLGLPVRALLAVAGALVILAAGTAVLVRVRAGTDRRRWAALATLTAVATALGLTCLATQVAVREAGPVGELAQARATVSLDAEVVEEPRLVTSRPGRPDAQPLVVLRLAVDSVTGRGSRASVQSPVLVLADPSWLAVRWRERVRVTGRLGPTQDPGDDVVAVFTPGGPPMSLAPPGPVERVAEVVRERFRLATDHLPADARGLLPGLVIGDTRATPPDLTSAMLATGMTHLSAVSGSNVAIILAAGLGLCRALGLRRRWRPLAALALLGAFVVLVRPEPSVVRAAVMGAVGLLGMTTSRRRAGLPALSAAILILLCWDPWLARSFGFALSALATLGLLLFAGPWGQAVGRWLPGPTRRWGPAIAVPAAAQLMCAPVVVLLQGSVTVVGVVANLLAAPLVAPATVLGVATALVAVLSTPVAAVLAGVAALPTTGIAWVARTCATVPMASVPWPDGAPGAVLLTVLSILGVVTGPWLLHHGRLRPLAVISALALGVAAVLPTRLVTWPDPRWQLVVCDVGQGDGMVLRSGPDGAVLVDVGPDPDAIDGCLRRLGVQHVEAIVLTHFHADHVDGLPGAIRGRQVRQILTSPVEEPAFQAQEVKRWASAASVPLSPVYAGDDLAWPGVTAHVWWPDRVIREGSVPNNASVVLTVNLNGTRMVLLGDVEREAAHQVLLALRRDGSALAGGFDVLKVAHHGSANRDDDLLAALHAPLAVISVGAGNDYGHPASSTIHALEADGLRIARTDQDGDVSVSRSSDGAVLLAARH
ncbi:MAG: ComEC/Rec2 family competence protein [Actinomycetota bacterium]|nr:ComEC/Rec2 family competence protein [Actinomycetota bacterium]